jgi:hypothetical protein
VINARVLDKETKSSGQKESISMYMLFGGMGGQAFCYTFLLYLLFVSRWVRPEWESQDTSLFFPLPETVVRHSILCHSFLAGGPTLFELFTADFFHVSSIITIILSKAER